MAAKDFPTTTTPTTRTEQKKELFLIFVLSAERTKL